MPGVELPDEDTLWERMEALLHTWEDGTAEFPYPVTTPTLFGERHDPQATAAVSGWGGGGVYYP